MTDMGFFADDERPTMMFYVFLGEHGQQTTPPSPKYKLTIRRPPDMLLSMGFLRYYKISSPGTEGALMLIRVQDARPSDNVGEDEES